jgi:two-component system sensor histidine kinase DesK
VSILSGEHVEPDPPTLNSVTTDTGSTRAGGRPFADAWRDAVSRIRSSGARRWYFGSLWGLAYLAIPVILTWVGPVDPVPATLLTIHVVVLAAIYVVLPPLLWGRPWPVAAIAYALFFGYTCLAFPLIGLDTMWFWLYVPIMAAMSWLPARLTITTIVVVVGAQLVLMATTGSFATYWYVAALTASISVMMLTFGEQIKAIARLRDAQSEIARLAVVDERERFARDMHDVLGHSLTVVTVKSELARKLVARDPDRAEAELADIERLARAALADLRASVAGYRAMTLETELSAAHAALVAADIVPHLPASGDVVAPQLREAFAWILRESVTNVVRHSGAKNCWVGLERDAVMIGDDGRGMPATVAGGHGLSGLGERAAKAGATLTIGPSDDGGTLITVRAE